MQTRSEQTLITELLSIRTAGTHFPWLLLEDLNSLIVDAAIDYKNWTLTPNVISNEPAFESNAESPDSSVGWEFVQLGPPRHNFYFEFESIVVVGAFEGFDANEMIDDSAYFPDFVVIVLTLMKKKLISKGIFLKRSDL